jgi:hypothetical protein
MFRQRGSVRPGHETSDGLSRPESDGLTQLGERSDVELRDVLATMESLVGRTRVRSTSDMHVVVIDLQIAMD